MNLKNQTLWAWIANIALIMIAVSLIPPLDRQHMTVMRWVYASGAILSLIARMMQKPAADTLRARRLQRINVWSSLFFCVGAVMLFWPGAGSQDWLAFTLAGAAIIVYTSIITPKISRGK